MTDLSNWDVANDFTGEDAAALAVGDDPAQTGYTRSKSKPLFELMKRSYDFAREWHRAESNPSCEYELNADDAMLQSWVMHPPGTEPVAGSRHFLVEWLNDESSSSFENQRFTRQEIARWLSAMGILSKYPFVIGRGRPVREADKPLGTIERNTLMVIIAALAKAAKINIDPPGKAALSIEGFTDELGAHVSKRAIEEHLKSIPNALESRKK